MNKPVIFVERNDCYWIPISKDDAVEKINTKTHGFIEFVSNYSNKNEFIVLLYPIGSIRDDLTIEEMADEAMYSYVTYLENITGISII